MNFVNMKDGVTRQQLDWCYQNTRERADKLRLIWGDPKVAESRQRRAFKLWSIAATRCARFYAISKYNDATNEMPPRMLQELNNEIEKATK